MFIIVNWDDKTVTCCEELQDAVTEMAPLKEADVFKHDQQLLDVEGGISQLDAIMGMAEGQYWSTND
jgi:hypothetical protein